MQKSPLIDDGCTVLDDPYVLLEADMFGHEISSEMPLFLPWRPLCLAQETLVAERLRFFWLRGDVYRDSGFSRTVDHERAPLVHDTSSCV